jgi:ribosomal protein S17
MIIIKDTIVIMKCRMTSRTLFPYFNLFSNDPKVKYHGTYNNDGFGVVIRNLSEADLNVTYRCVYGFDQSTSKYLLHVDVFRESIKDTIVIMKCRMTSRTLFPYFNLCLSEKWIASHVHLHLHSFLPDLYYKIFL